MCCVTLSELFFGETIGDTVYLQKIIYHFSRFCVCCMLSKKNFKLSLVSRERNDREPNGEVYEIWVLRDIFGIVSWVSQSATL